MRPVVVTTRNLSETPPSCPAPGSNPYLAASAPEAIGSRSAWGWPTSGMIGAAISGCTRPFRVGACLSAWTAAGLTKLVKLRLLISDISGLRLGQFLRHHLHLGPVKPVDFTPKSPNLSCGFTARIEFPDCLARG